MLTRNEMEVVLQKGGTVLHNGEMIYRVEDLPSPGELAAGDGAKLRTELARLDKQAAELAGQRAKVIAALSLAEEDAHRAEESVKNAAKPVDTKPVDPKSQRQQPVKPEKQPEKA